MSIKNKLTGAALSLALIATLGVSAYAQQVTSTDNAASQSKTGRMHRGARRHHGSPVMRIIRKLQLTDAQQEQARAIVQRFKTSIEPQRQALMELHKQRVEGTVSEDVRVKATALRGQIRESMKGAQGELLAILNTEQRAQYDQMESNWKARQLERRARRAERRLRKSTQTQTPAQ